MKRLIYSLRTSSSFFLTCICAIGIAGILMGAPQSASAATFNVNSTLDLPDVIPGDGLCNTNVATCTVRAAVMEANASAGADTINIPAGTYTLTLGPFDDEFNFDGAKQESGDLDIVNGDVTIIGAGAATTIIDGGGIDRIFDINSGFTFTPGTPGNVRIENVTLRNGDSPTDSFGFFHSGGAIQFDGLDWNTFSLANITLTVVNCVISDNVAAGQGGGIASFNGGSVAVSGTSFSGNDSTNAQGGAIFFDGASDAGTRTFQVTTSSFASNTAANATFGSGGAIWSGGSATVNIDNNSFTNNVAGANGGAIFADAFVAANMKTIEKNRIEDNSAQVGGGVFNRNGTLTFQFNVVVGNTASADPTSTGFRQGTSSAAGSTATLTNNWWGCNEGPSTLPCDRASGALGFGSGPWLVLSHTATPNTILVNTSTTLQADFFTNSSAASVAPADLVALNGRPITFNNAVLGTISGADTAISGGKANATYTAGPIGGSGSADATVDSATVTATINIQEPAGITCPANIVTTTDPGECTASVSFAATATGFPAPTITYTIGATVITSPHTFPSGTTTVTATASNGLGEDATCTFDVTVNDDEPPNISCPANITVSNDPGTCGAVVNYTAPTGTDNCAGATTNQTAGLPSGSTFPVGTTTNTFTVTDAAGNESSCSFTVTVNDTEDPVVTVPADITVSTDPGTCSAVVNFNPTATDNCAGVTVMSSPASGSTFPKGTTLVTVTATDASGNQDVDTFNVTVNDNEAPAITCPANIVVDAPEGECAAQVNFTITATDNCPGMVTINSSPASGSIFPVGTTMVNASATDASGNVANCSFTVTVRDNTDPVITLNGQTPVLWPPDHDYRTINITDLVASASDECDASVDINDVVISQVSSDELEDGPADGSTLNDMVIAGDCKSVQLRAERQASGNGRVYTITFKVTDSGGNSTTVTAQVIVPTTGPGSGAVLGPGPGYTVISACP